MVFTRKDEIFMGYVSFREGICQEIQFKDTPMILQVEGKDGQNKLNIICCSMLRYMNIE